MELQWCCDAIFVVLLGFLFVRLVGGWLLLFDVVQFGYVFGEVLWLLLEFGVVVIGMVGWGVEVAGCYVRFVYSVELVDCFDLLCERAVTLLNRC